MLTGQAKSNDSQDPSKPVNFLFLADPQPNRATGQRVQENLRVKILSNLNAELQKLPSMKWPNRLGNLSGQPIGEIVGLFFGGDLCQTGGDYSYTDQLGYLPGTYHGGWELEIVRLLFDPNYKAYGSGDDGKPIADYTVSRNVFSPIYFGLGNHDVQSEFVPTNIIPHPAYFIPWNKGCSASSDPESPDYFRWQMWNFITQMHTGNRGIAARGDFPSKVTCKPQPCSPRFPATLMHADGQSFDWTQYSFNYMVDLGPVDVYQLHRYGGDNDFGRESGWDWLQQTLKQRGTIRPVIIIQHYTFQFKDIPMPPKPFWNENQRDTLLKLLAPFNVVALLTGHIHELPRNWPYKANDFNEFRPGSCACEDATTLGNFALVHVNPDSRKIIVVRGYLKDATGQAVLTFDDVANLAIDYPFNNGELVTDIKSGAIYLIDQECLRLIPNLLTLNHVFVNRTSVNVPDQFFLDNPQKGTSLTYKEWFVDQEVHLSYGAVVVQTTDGNFLIDNEVKRWIDGSAYTEWGFQQAIPVPDFALTFIDSGDPIISSSGEESSITERNVQSNLMVEDPSLIMGVAGLQDGLWCQDNNSGSKYLMDVGLLRLLPDMQTVFNLRGNDALIWYGINSGSYTSGPPIPSGSTIVQGFDYNGALNPRFYWLDYWFYMGVEFRIKRWVTASGLQKYKFQTNTVHIPQIILDYIQSGQSV
jgi:hypothetical protein